MASSFEIGYTANIVLAVFLLGLAFAVGRRSSAPGHVPLAVFLALVGANYALDAFDTATGRRMPFLAHAALVAVLLDPPALLAFALATAGRPLGRRRLALVLAPGVALAILYVAFPSPTARLTNWPLAPAYFLELGGFYALAFGVLLRRYLRVATEAERERLGALVVAFGVVVLPRLAILAAEARVALLGGRFRSDTTFLLLEVALGVVVLVAYLLARGRVAPGAEAHARRVAMATLALVGVVAAVWTLNLVPAVRDPAFPLVYSARWVLFSGVVVAGAHRLDLFDLPESTVRTLQVGFGVLVTGVAALDLASLLASLPQVGSDAALAVGFAVAAAGAAAVVAVRRALPSAAEAERRSNAYRALVDLGADEGTLEEARRGLGVGTERARALRSGPGADAPAVELSEGRVVLGRYQVDAFLGAGAFGRVFLARDTGGGGRVVLKELAPAWRDDEEAVERFRREAETAVRIRHPNLAAFRALERVRGGHLLVLDHVEGETLRERLDRGPLPGAEAARVGRDVLAGLGALHRAGIVHRDVKPENIVLRGDGRAVLLDFGAATVPRSGGTRLAGRGHPGTPAYMSPEQAAGEDVGPASDLYAVGLVLWEAVAGSSRVDPPPVWKPILQRALERVPGRRYPDVDAFSAALPAS